MSALPLRQLDLELVHPTDHFARLHTDARGTAILWEKQATDNRWTKLRPGDPAVPAILAAQVGQLDRYMTVNEFHAWRVVKQLKSLRACYVDIDDPSITIEAAVDSLDAAQMPRPTFAIMSGRGIHLYWQIDPVPAQALPVWQRVQDALVSAVRGADRNARDCARVLRLVGSVHSGTGRDVRGVVLGQAWTLHTLADEVLGPRKPAQVRDLAAARARSSRPRVASGSIYDRWNLVYRDIVAIGDYHRRAHGGIPQGHRDAWLHLYGVALSWFAEPDTLVDEVTMAARTWTRDLSQADVRAALTSTLERAVKARNGETVTWRGEQRDSRYWYKRETLHSIMQPLIPPDLAGQLRAVIPDSVAQQRLADRNLARYQDHYTGAGVRASRLEAREEARRLRADEGMSTRAIAGRLDVNQSTIARWLASTER